MNPEIKNATQNDIDRYLYHNVPEYHHKKKEAVIVKTITC